MADSENLKPLINEVTALFEGLIEKPQMQEKKLERPPFSFLYDIVINLAKHCGYPPRSVFTKEDKNIETKEDRLRFLIKIVDTVQKDTGKADVNPKSIAKGVEVDKTLKFLIALGTEAKKIKSGAEPKHSSKAQPSKPTPNDDDLNAREREREREKEKQRELERQQEEEERLRKEKEAEEKKKKEEEQKKRRELAEKKKREQEEEEERKRLEREKAEKEQIERERLEAERKKKEEAERLERERKQKEENARLEEERRVTEAISSKQIISTSVNTQRPPPTAAQNRRQKRIVERQIESPPSLNEAVTSGNIKQDESNLANQNFGSYDEIGVINQMDAMGLDNFGLGMDGLGMDMGMGMDGIGLNMNAGLDMGGLGLFSDMGPSVDTTSDFTTFGQDNSASKLQQQQTISDDKGFASGENSKVPGGALTSDILNAAQSFDSGKGTSELQQQILDKKQTISDNNASDNDSSQRVINSLSMLMKSLVPFSKGIDSVGEFLLKAKNDCTILQSKKMQILAAYGNQLSQGGPNYISQGFPQNNSNNNIVASTEVFERYRKNINDNSMKYMSKSEAMKRKTEDLRSEKYAILY